MLGDLLLGLLDLSRHALDLRDRLILLAAELLVLGRNLVELRLHLLELRLSVVKRIERLLRGLGLRECRDGIREQRGSTRGGEHRLDGRTTRNVAGSAPAGGHSVQRPARR